MYIHCGCMAKNVLLMGVQGQSTETTAIKNGNPFEEFKPGGDKIRFYFGKITPSEEWRMS